MQRHILLVLCFIGASVSWKIALIHKNHNNQTIKSDQHKLVTPINQLVAENISKELVKVANVSSHGFLAKLDKNRNLLLVEPSKYYMIIYPSYFYVLYINCLKDGANKSGEKYFLHPERGILNTKDQLEKPILDDLLRFNLNPILFTSIDKSLSTKLH
jgi:hypothetical protein